MNAASCACGSCGQVTCGCCSGIEVLTPQPTANRPGLTSLHYRIGTHGSFLESMKARLGLHELHDTEAAAREVDNPGCERCLHRVPRRVGVRG